MSDSNIEIKEEGEELDELDSNEKAEEGVAWEPSWKAETEHYFYLKSFKKPIYCQVCQSFIWGLRKQGFSCEGQLSIISLLFFYFLSSTFKNVF